MHPKFEQHDAATDAPANDAATVAPANDRDDAAAWAASTWKPDSCGGFELEDCDRVPDQEPDEEPDQELDQEPARDDGDEEPYGIDDDAGYDPYTGGWSDDC